MGFLQNSLDKFLKRPLSKEFKSSTLGADESFSVEVDPEKKGIYFGYKVRFRSFRDIPLVQKIKRFFHE